MIHQDSLGNVLYEPRNVPAKQHMAANGLERIFYQNDTGDSDVISYEVFPGIRVVYKFVHMEVHPMDRGSPKQLLEIHYCREGQLGCRLEQESFFLTPGKFAVVKVPKNTSGFVFPLGHYHGISVIMEEAQVRQTLPYFLREIGVDPIAMGNRLCNSAGYYSAEADAHINRLFSELYTLPGNPQKGYLKIRVLELLLALNDLTTEAAVHPPVPLPPEQTELADQIVEYLRTHIDRHITAEELSLQFHLSKTHLRNIFKHVYGVPIYSYIRIQKMQIAAIRLARTSMTVLEIANACGYANASKFAAAFREVMGQTPVDYRNTHGIPQPDK